MKRRLLPFGAKAGVTLYEDEVRAAGVPERSGARALALGAAITLLVMQSGCFVLLVGGVAAAGVGGYAYVKGESTAVLAASMDRSWNATVAALEDLRLPVIAKANDALSGEITARNASDTKITISLRRVSDNATEIGIRVGTFGDEAQSKAILDRIAAHL
ncbi:MAG TPA: hypothetical protein DCM87_09005 [Planctomycetes bacterium]|nr:hypothetical protein [Planctomycetota bacterium]